MKKTHDFTLFTPGPVNIAPRVLAAGMRPMIHHRTPEFHCILENVICKMQQLFGTKKDVLLVHTTGRGAMEGTLRSLFSPQDKILSICNGRFGNMFADIGQSCDLSVQRIFLDWLTPIELEQLDNVLKNNPNIKGVTVVHSDTATAMVNPISAIGEIVRRHNRLLVVDCISTLGAMEFRMDDWHADVAITASQKGLMAPAGISFVAINQRAWEAVHKAEKPGFYINFKKIKAFYDDKRETPGSTPVSLVTSVNESLDMIFEEGLKEVYRRHALISKAIKLSLESMGLSLCPTGDFDRSNIVTLVNSPMNFKPSLIKEMAKKNYGIIIASGLGKLKESTFRIGHVGMVTVREALLVVSALELILLELDIVQSPGKGLEAFYHIRKNQL